MVPLEQPAAVGVQPSDTCRQYVESRLGFTDRQTPEEDSATDNDDNDVLTSARSSLPQLSDTMRPVTTTLPHSRIRSSLLKPLPAFDESSVMSTSSGSSQECGGCCEVGDSVRYESSLAMICCHDGEN